MFCIKCGYQLNDDAFCQHCGAKLQMLATANVAVQAETSEINKDALMIYLKDVLSLECIKRKYKIKIRELQNTATHIKRNNLYKTDQLFGDYNPRAASSSCFHLFYNGKRFYIAYVGEEHYNHGVYTNDLLIKEKDWQWMDIESNLHYLKTPYAWRQSTYPCTGRFEERGRRIKARDKFLRVYEDFKKKAPSLYQKNIKNLDNNVRTQKAISQELLALDNLLEKEYDLNIIPGQFRNLYAVYYLHEFIATSRETLTTALLHCDLNEIKYRLDRIIEQQREIIVQQALMISQNEQLIHQNKVQLEQMASLEQNVGRAVQYTEIAANNAKACALIGLANYLKD